MRHVSSERKRLSSKKRRKRSLSRHSEDDDYLVNVLNKRAANENKVVLSKEEYKELRTLKKSLKETKARINSSTLEAAKYQQKYEVLEKSNKRLNQDYQKLISEKEELLKQIQTLTYNNTRLSKKVDELETTSSQSVRKQQKSMQSLKKNMKEIETQLIQKSSACRRHLSKVQKQIAGLQSLSKDSGFPQILRNKFSKLCNDLASSVDKSLNVLAASDVDDFEDDHLYDLQQENSYLKDELSRVADKENTISEYRTLIDRMREQMYSMRERLSDVKDSSRLKEALKEKDEIIALLETDKVAQRDHINTLRVTLEQQAGVIEHLKTIISNVSRGNTDRSQHSPIASPPLQEFLESRIPSQSNILHDSSEYRLQNEISALDQEIQELQASLQRALASQ